MPNIALRQAGASDIEGQDVRIAMDFDRTTSNFLRVEPRAGGQGDAIGPNALTGTERGETSAARVPHPYDVTVLCADPHGRVGVQGRNLAPVIL